MGASSSMFADIRRFMALADVQLGPNGYPIDPVTDCVDPVDPDDWLDAFTNTIEDADAMSVKGLTNNIPSYSSSEPPATTRCACAKRATRQCYVAVCDHVAAC